MEKQNSINNRDTIIAIVSKTVKEPETYIYRDQLTITVPKDKVLKVAKDLRDSNDTKFEQCLDVTAIDWNRPKNRFDLIYILYSLTHNHRVRLRVPLEEEDPSSPSLSSIWESCNWYERETYDMYGVTFTNHPDLRRFYMPEDFVDPESGEPLYPLRKDFPLTGIPGSLPLPAYPEKYGDIID
ncbi:NADH-quinone oxidoreductase subunit C [Candidatus Kapabacteria bacterium]|nr:NADH-quinone oxidoreductase subunit C [Candidatus Kapabacteria bacterium]